MGRKRTNRPSTGGRQIREDVQGVGFGLGFVGTPYQHAKGRLALQGDGDWASSPSEKGNHGEDGPDTAGVSDVRVAYLDPLEAPSLPGLSELLDPTIILPRGGP